MQTYFIRLLANSFSKKCNDKKGYIRIEYCDRDRYIAE